MSRRQQGALMVCGCASHVGKSLVVAGLCRAFSDRGLAVAPFKGQNMALNSTVTTDGREIGRAQALQAAAARVPPEAAMNPILLKPNDDRSSQVLVMGRPWDSLDAATYHRRKPELLPTVLDALEDLRSRFELVVLEGAGSAAEINLLEGDLVNLSLARAAGVPAVVVGDIDRGGVFAHLFGTVALLPEDLRSQVRGFVLNKFRGDPSLLGDATEVLARSTGVPTLGVLPWLDGVHLDAEDSLGIPWAEAERESPVDDPLQVAVVALPRMSNFTDVDPLAVEPAVSLRFVRHPAQLHGADLVILPGTKDTTGDLAWLRARRFDEVLGQRSAGRPAPVLLGICGGYQMLGRLVDEPGRATEGLGLLDVAATFDADKVLARCEGRHPASGTAVAGYLIHHNRPKVGPGVAPLFELGGVPEGAADEERGVFATSLHGLFEADGFRGAFLSLVAERAGKSYVASGRSFEAARQAQIDRVAKACATHLDLDALAGLACEVVS